MSVDFGPKKHASLFHKLSSLVRAPTAHVAARPRPAAAAPLLGLFKKDVFVARAKPQQAAAATPANARAQRAAEGARHVEEAYRRGGALEGSRELHRQAEARKDDPAAVAELVKASRPTIEQISRDLAKRIEDGKDDTREQPVTKESIRELAAVAELGGPEAAQEIAQPLARALPNKDNLNQFDDAFNELDHTGEGVTLGLALAGELRAACKDKTAGQIEGEAFDAIGNLRGDYQDTRKAREELDATLQHQLSEFKDILTPEQQQQYIEQFHEEHKDTYRAEVEAAQRLSDTLGKNADALNRAVLANPGRADDVVDAFKDVASSPLPAAAAEWAAKTFEDGSPTARVFAEHADEIRTDIVEKAMAGTLTQYQGEAGGDSAPALDRLEQLYKSYGKAKTLFKSPEQFADAMKRGRELLDAFHALDRGDRLPLEKLLKDSNKLSGFSDPLSAGLSVAGLAFAVVNLTDAHDVTSLVQGVAQTSKAGLSLASKAIGTLNETGRLTQLLGESGAARAVGFARFANRLVPGLAVGLDALATTQSFMDLLHSGKATDALKLIGDVTSLVGSVISLFPPAEPIGKIFEVVGLGLSELASAIGGAQDRERFNQEQQKILKKVLAGEFQGDPEALDQVTRQMAFASPDLNKIKRNAGLDQRQFFELMNKVEDSNDRNFPLLIEVAASVGLQGQRFLDAIEDLDRRYDGDLISVFADIGMVMGNMTTEDQRQQALRLLAERYELV